MRSTFFHAQKIDPVLNRANLKKCLLRYLPLSESNRQVSRVKLFFLWDDFVGRESGT